MRGRHGGGGWECCGERQCTPVVGWAAAGAVQVHTLLAGRLQSQPQGMTVAACHVLAGSRCNSCAVLAHARLNCSAALLPAAAVASIDLGGGSVQEAYAMTEAEAAAAPDKQYLTELHSGGKTYHVYVYRWGETSAAAWGWGGTKPAAAHLCPRQKRSCSKPL